MREFVKQGGIGSGPCGTVLPIERGLGFFVVVGRGDGDAFRGFQQFFQHVLRRQLGPQLVQRAIHNKFVSKVFVQLGDVAGRQQVRAAKGVGTDHVRHGMRQ